MRGKTMGVGWAVVDGAGEEVDFMTYVIVEEV